MKSYAQWDEYLKIARNGYDRPINGTRSHRVLRGTDGDIILRLHSTNVVTLHADGTETINTGGWHTITTMKFISEHSRARVWRASNQLYVRTDSPTFTAPRVQKCRRCQDGQIKQCCQGPGWCYAEYRGSACEHGQTVNHRRSQCEHGQTTGHGLPSVDCWQCHGVGRFDYGSNAVHYQWDGRQLTIDSDGYPVGPASRWITDSPVVRRTRVTAAPARRPAPQLSPEWSNNSSETLGKYASDGRYAREFGTREGLEDLIADIDTLTSVGNE
jgi:hypothetical protein